ncbi:MAG: hypothetical protein HYZ34_12240, partial [Ignavibacteriae bacterium]|nr:hypothetical protein [Ignavibacteriota bacterium]
MHTIFIKLLIIVPMFFLLSCEEETSDPRIGRPEVVILHPSDNSFLIDST